MATVQIPEAEYARLRAVAMAAQEAVDAADKGEVRRHVAAWQMLRVAVEMLRTGGE